MMISTSSNKQSGTGKSSALVEFYGTREKIRRASINFWPDRSDRNSPRVDFGVWVSLGLLLLLVGVAWLRRLANATSSPAAVASRRDRCDSNLPETLVWPLGGQTSREAQEQARKALKCNTREQLFVFLSLELTQTRKPIAAFKALSVGLWFRAPRELRN